MNPNTPEIPIKKRGSEEILEDLCIALRNVGIRDYDLPGDSGVLAFIQEVKDLFEEVRRRNLSYSDRIALLTEQTKWQIDVLLNECLEFPKVIPYVRNIEGFRRVFKCQFCGTQERPIEDTKYYLCDQCLEKIKFCISNRQPLKGIFLFQTYNPEHWCKHGSPAEIYAEVMNDEYLSGFGFCEKCLTEEAGRRKIKTNK